MIEVHDRAQAFKLAFLLPSCVCPQLLLLGPCLLLGPDRGVALDLCHSALELGKGGFASGGPGLQRSQHVGDGARGNVAQGRNRADDDALGGRVERGAHEVGVDGIRD